VQRHLLGEPGPHPADLSLLEDLSQGNMCWVGSAHGCQGWERGVWRWKSQFKYGLDSTWDSQKGAPNVLSVLREARWWICLHLPEAVSENILQLNVLNAGNNETLLKLPCLPKAMGGQIG
jgi:hypothetical protein